MPSPRLTTTALAMALLAVAGGARADDDEARSKKLFDQGVTQMEAKKYDAACPAIEESQRLDPHPGTLFTLAECEALRGRAAAAYSHYGEYLDVYASLPRDKQAKQGTREKDARTQRGVLAKRIAQVTLALPGSAPSGTSVTLDDRPVEPRERSAAIALEAGDHVAVTKAPDGTTTERRFKVEKGDTTTIELEVRTAPGPRPTAAPTVTAPPETPSSGHRTFAFIAGGVGLAGLVAGGVTGGLMLSEKGTVDASCKDGTAGVKLCSAAGVEAGNNAKLFGTIATVGLAAGVAFAGLAVVLFATAPKRPAPGATPTGALQVRVESRGAAGTMVGVRGSF